MTNTDLATANNTAIATVDEQTVRDYLFGLKDPINEKQQNLFLNIAKANNLNPFKREIYAVWYGDSFSIVTWYQVYIDKANATGLLNGWSCEIIKNQAWEIEGAKVIIHRKDWEKPFEWIVDFDEFAGTYFDKYKKEQVLNKIWASKGKFMIKKVAIGQGFRLCFPSELWSLPYLAEEIANKDEKEVVDANIIDTENTEIEAETVETIESTPETTNEPETEKETEEMPENVDEIDQKSLPANKVKQVQIKWKEFAEKSWWNFEESEKKRKATMKKYFNVDSTKDLTVEQADEFVAKIDQAIEKILY